MSIVFERTPEGIQLLVACDYCQGEMAAQEGVLLCLPIGGETYIPPLSAHAWCLEEWRSEGAPDFAAVVELAVLPAALLRALDITGKESASAAAQYASREDDEDDEDDESG